MNVRNYLVERLDQWANFVLAGAYGVNHSKNSMEELQTKIQDNTVKDPVLNWVIASDRGHQRTEVAVDRFVQAQNPKVRRMLYLLHVGTRVFDEDQGRYLHARSTPTAAARSLGCSAPALRSAYDRALARLARHLRAPTIVSGSELRDISKARALKWLRHHRADQLDLNKNPRRGRPGARTTPPGASPSPSAPSPRRSPG